MDSKVIPLRNKHTHKLSRLMIVALVEAAVKQNHGIPFGPVDIKGSFTALLNRGLIVPGTQISKQHTHSAWQVTPEGLSILRTMGVDVTS